MSPTTVELLFMGTECETNGPEALNTVRDMKSPDAKTAVEQTQAILAWLAFRNMIGLFLGNPLTYEPDPRGCDPAGTNLICADRLRLRDNSDDRWLLCDATPWGGLMSENRWAILRETEKGSINRWWPDLGRAPTQ